MDPRAEYWRARVWAMRVPGEGDTFERIVSEHAAATVDMIQGQPGAKDRARQVVTRWVRQMTHAAPEDMCSGGVQRDFEGACGDLLRRFQEMLERMIGGRNAVSRTEWQAYGRVLYMFFRALRPSDPSVPRQIDRAWCAYVKQIDQAVYLARARGLESDDYYEAGTDLLYWGRALGFTLDNEL